ncbi:MAG: iron-sulfur cluster assembly scaffold protein [Candidatus Moranbacteria bacterium RIFCSPHIGHO2_02_FULL_40_12b]|nr:MAG: iron-sulfur cluster assembly scaffold protein [Candidatus Moranbacteria bacterium RIFCSPHIGHO2_02_FULL_40_12b]OGI23482.1 MAG: iron-sulfur cluster assembly scaffold protein [Candidatus Moranbacteria bacterium RIFCSPHIGHO2_12_FULL_40_10]
MQFYSKKVLEHFTRPHNQGKIKNPSAVATVGNPRCGDIMRLYIKVSKNKKGTEILEDVKFETLGCGAAIATSSMITDLAKGKTLEEAMKISRNDVSEELQGLPPAKEHCSNLAAEALHKAIEEYNKRKIKKKK